MIITTNRMKLNSVQNRLVPFVLKRIHYIAFVSNESCLSVFDLDILSTYGEH
jgi:hypothetical protein